MERLILCRSMLKSSQIIVSDETEISEGKFSKNEMREWKSVLGGRNIEPTTVALFKCTTLRKTHFR